MDETEFVVHSVERLGVPEKQVSVWNPAVLRFARLFAVNSRACICAASPAHAA